MLEGFTLSLQTRDPAQGFVIYRKDTADPGLTIAAFPLSPNHIGWAMEAARDLDGQTATRIGLASQGARYTRPLAILGSTLRFLEAFGVRSALDALPYPPDLA